MITTKICLLVTTVHVNFWVKQGCTLELTCTTILVPSIHSLQPALRAVLATERKTGFFAQKCLQFNDPVYKIDSFHDFMFICSVVSACSLLVLQKNKLSSPQEAPDEVFTKEEGESISNDAEEPALDYLLMNKSSKSLSQRNIQTT